MGLFDFLRRGRASTPPTAQAVQLANAYLETVYARVVGKPVSLGVKLVTTELLGGRAVSRALVSTPEAFRLGVVHCFALLATIDPDRKFLGIIKTNTTTDSGLYRQDRLAPNEVPLQDYLSAFGITVLQTDTADVSSVSSLLAAKKKLLAVTSSSVALASFKGAGRGQGATVWIVEDDGTSAKSVVP